jgi:hypothetical protein
MEAFRIKASLRRARRSRCGLMTAGFGQPVAGGLLSPFTAFVLGVAPADDLVDVTLCQQELVRRDIHQVRVVCRRASLVGQMG